MLDRQRIRDQIVFLICLILVSVGLDSSYVLVGAATIALLISVSLFFSLTPTVLPKISKDIFAEKVSIQEFKEVCRESPELRNSLEYCLKLSNEDFLRFTRLAVEVRYLYDQKALKEVGDLFRK